MTSAQIKKQPSCPHVPKPKVTALLTFISIHSLVLPVPELHPGASSTYRSFTLGHPACTISSGGFRISDVCVIYAGRLLEPLGTELGCRLRLLPTLQGARRNASWPRVVGGTQEIKLARFGQIRSSMNVQQRWTQVFQKPLLLIREATCVLGDSETPGVVRAIRREHWATVHEKRERGFPEEHRVVWELRASREETRCSGSNSNNFLKMVNLFRVVAL